MASKALPAAHKLYRVPKTDIFSGGVRARLPEAYRKFYEEWKGPKSPVHYRPEPGKWKRDPLTGEVWPVQNNPILVQYPKQINTGIWGGEGCILGCVKGTHRLQQRVTKWWMPVLRKSAVYSEILDKRLLLIVTKRTIDLVIENQGFDHYILKTSASDLDSMLALKLKKKMLFALFDKTLYPDNPTKQEEIYNKYRHYLANYNKEDLEWYAMDISEAVNKLMEIEDSVQAKPLKHQFRAELINELKTMAANQELDQIVKGGEVESKSWLSRINPFAKKT